MVFEINNGRLRKCKDTIGGIKSAYLAPYKKVLRSEIEFDGTNLTEFPQTFIYKFELVSADIFSQDGNENEGGKYYDQNIELTFNKISAFDNLQFQRLLRKDYFMVIEDYNGNFFLLGFRNGLTANSLDVSNQQYKISFNGQEEELAPFCEELMNTDLIVIDYEDYIFENEDNYIFENDENYIWY